MCEVAEMAATMAGGAVACEWVGLRPSVNAASPLRSAAKPETQKSCGNGVVRMALSLEKKYVTKKSEDVFTAAKVHPPPTPVI